MADGYPQPGFLDMSVISKYANMNSIGVSFTARQLSYPQSVKRLNRVQSSVT